jgi:exonuclease SbcC
VISRLFKGRKRLDSDNARERKEALDGLGAGDISSDELAQLIRTDPDRDVRRAALARLMDPTVLASLLDDERVGAEVCSHVARLLDSGEDSRTVQAVQGLTNHPGVLGARLAGAPSDSLIQSVLGQNDPELLLIAVLSTDKAHRDALLEHDQFHRAAVLQELEHRSRHRDKRLNRFARDRLDRIRHARADGERLVARISERLASLERTTDAPSPTDARNRPALLDSIGKELQTLEGVAAVMAEAGEPISDIDGLEERLRVLTDQAPPVADEHIGSAAREEDPFEALCGGFTELERSLEERSDFEALAARRQTLTDEWLAAADHSPPEPRQHEIFERVSHRFHELAEAHARLADTTLPTLDLPDAPAPDDPELPADGARAFDALARDMSRAGKALSAVRWPDWAVAPEPLASLSATLDAAESRMEAWRSAVAQADARAGEMLRSLAAHVDAGELTKARTEAGRIRNLIASLPRNLAQPLSKELAGVSARMSELSDWQTFATTPKREHLLEAMQGLVDHPLPPKDQAARIKQLRAEWNELGPASRGPDHRLLEQFNEAAEKAFEPCRAYFADQASVRARNLAAREEIASSLAAYLEKTDWSQADYKAAEQIMRAARREWRQHHPVDRTPGKPLEARFEKLQAELHGHIKTEWNRNLDIKRQIVAEAQSLAEAADDIRDRIAAAKALQQRWKAVGTTPRRPDQALWRDFRKACDRIFAVRDEARQHADESLKATETSIRAVIDELHAALDTGAELNDASLRDFQHRFDELPRVPERRQRILEREFGELMKTARVTLKAARQVAERQRLLGLESLDRDVSDLERRHLAGESVTFESPDPVFEERWQQVNDAVPLEELRRATIEAEIAAGMESPDADRERRLAFQVELMNTGRSRDALDADPADLTDRWCRIGPKSDQADELRERFFRAIDKLVER